MELPNYIEPTKKGNAFPLLDSRLISRTNRKKYNIKVVDCGEYIQVYKYEYCKLISNKSFYEDFSLKKNDNFFKEDNKLQEESKTQKQPLNNSEKCIEKRNILRSKLMCQRIAKANSKIWESFITLTFEKNIQSIKDANKYFQNFIRQVKRVKKDFAYIAIPEFQKRGAIHYHLLCNINSNDKALIYSQEDNSYFKHIKYWKHGFTSIETMKGDIKKIVGYISKYMTKDIDNRLFGHHRFFYSQNLNIPKTSYVDVEQKFDKDFYTKKIQDKELIYQNQYTNIYDNSKVIFLEFSTKSLHQNLNKVKNNFSNFENIKSNVNVKTE